MHVVFRFGGPFLTGLCFLLLAGRLFAQAPVITLEPQSQTNSIGASVTFSVEATGTLPLIYQWYFNGALISSDTNGILSVTINSVLNSGIYLAIVTNELGSATSAPATLTFVGAPAFLTQPTNQAVFLGQSATFSTETLSPGPVTYQWLFQGAGIEDATNATFTVVNATTNAAGLYSVQAQNQYGTRTSQSALLTVNPLPMPSLRLGFLTVTNRIRIPVLYTANSAETNIGFSVTWDSAVLTNATYEPEFLVEEEPEEPEEPLDPVAFPGFRRVRPTALPSDAVVTVNESQLPVGRLGVSIGWATNNLAPGESSIGQMIFDLVPGRTNPLTGLLGVTNLPVPAIFGPPLEGSNQIVLNPMNPQLLLAGDFNLNLQTGLQQQLLIYGHPGNNFVENTQMTVAGLGLDSLTNAIRLANAQGVLVASGLPYVDLGAIAPAEIREALMEYYVSDRVSVPTPSFDLQALPPFIIPPPSGNILTDVVTRTTNGLVLVEFPTQSLFRYYIQYATNLAGFTNGGFSTSLPAVNGTGSRRQWLDTGPPRTASPPFSGSRFYRVVEVQ